jgi:DNA-binding NarL/FixJ family response regulator
MDIINSTALIADDDEFFRMALRGVLMGKLGFSHVIEANNLDEAIECLSETGNISLAIFDLAMPGMETAASLRAVRECFPTTRVVMVSASKRRQDILLALEAGAHGYVPKGLGVAELSNALRTVVEGAIFVPSLMTDVSGLDNEATLPFAAVASIKPSQERSFTPRQHDVLELIIQGQSNKEICRKLTLSEGTVKVHVSALYRAMGVTSRSGAAAAGARLHLDS